MVDYYGKDPQNRKIGATEKRAKAKMYSRREIGKGTERTSPTLVVTLTFFLAAVLAMFLTDGPLVNGVHLSLHPLADPWLFGPGNPDILGAPDMNRLAAVLIRGVALFAAAGIIPGFTFLWQRLLNKQGISPYVAIWMTTLLVLLFAYVASLGLLSF